jgi:hypothetical protein
LKYLDYRFSVAPMMDWTDFAEKAKHNQNLSMVAVGHAGPNAVLTIFKKPLANNFGLPLSFGGCLVAQRIAPVYATDLFERMGRSLALGRSSAIQEHDHHQSIPRRMAAHGAQSGHWA